MFLFLSCMVRQPVGKRPLILGWFWLQLAADGNDLSEWATNVELLPGAETRVLIEVGLGNEVTNLKKVGLFSFDTSFDTGPASQDCGLSCNHAIS
jgi:hypothetical protein